MPTGFSHKRLLVDQANPKKKEYSSQLKNDRLIMAGQKSNWGKELRMGEGGPKPKKRGTAGRISGDLVKPEDFDGYGRRSGGHMKEEDYKRTSDRLNEDVSGAGRIADDQKMLDDPKSTLGNSDEEVEPKTETEINLKDASSVLSDDLRRSAAKELGDQTRVPGGQTRPEDQQGIAEVILQQTVSMSDVEEQEKNIDHFQKHNVAACQRQEVRNQKLSNDMPSELTTTSSVPSRKSLRI